MRRLLGRLSRGERFLLGLVLVALAVNLYLAWDFRHLNAQSGRLSERLDRDRANVEVAREESDLPRLQTERDQLAATLAKTIPEPSEDSKITLQLWRWAEQSGVTIVDMSSEVSPLSIGDDDFSSLNYAIKARGVPRALHRFISLADTSPYHPVVKRLALKPEKESDRWQMELLLMVVARPIKGAPAKKEAGQGGG